MKEFIGWSLVVMGLMAVGCGVAQKNVGVEVSSVANEKVASQAVSLSDEDQRKFDYFFYEGNRYKALGDGQKSFMYYSQALKVDPSCAVCNYELSRLLLGSQKYDEAEKLLERAVQLSPSNRFYIELLARVYQSNKSGDKAVATARKLLVGENPGLEEIYFVAKLQEQNGDFAGAIDNLKRMEETMGFNEGLVLEKYQLYLKNEDYSSAEKTLKGLIKRFPGNGDYPLYLGDFYLERKKWDQAFQQYQRSLERDPEDGKVYFSLANYYLQKKDNENFIAMFEKAFGSDNVDFNAKFQRFVPFLMGMDNATNPLDSVDFEELFNVLISTHPYEPKGYVGYGNFLMAKKNNKKAAEYFEKSLDLDALQDQVWQDYLFLLSGFGDNSKLLTKAEEALKFFPNNPFFHLFRGISLFQEEKLDKALVAFQTGLDHSSDNKALQGQFYAYIGDIHHSLGNLDACFASYDKALEIDENNLMVLNNYSYYLSLLGQNLEKAEKMSSKTVELDPGNATFLDTYAWVLFKRGRYLEAKFIIERAIDNNDDESGVIMEHYGDILFKNGDVEEAVRIWNKALKLKDHSKVLSKKISEKRFIDEE